jgi:hypothetical protein
LSTLFFAPKASQKGFAAMPTPYPLKVQAIRTQGTTPRLYVYFPIPLAAAIGLEPGETVQWELLDRGELHLVRLQPPEPTTKKRAPKRA